MANAKTPPKNVPATLWNIRPIGTWLTDQLVDGPMLTQRGSLVYYSPTGIDFYGTLFKKRGIDITEIKTVKAHAEAEKKVEAIFDDYEMFYDPTRFVSRRDYPNVSFFFDQNYNYYDVVAQINHSPLFTLDGPFIRHYTPVGESRFAEYFAYVGWPLHRVTTLARHFSVLTLVTTYDFGLFLAFDMQVPIEHFAKCVSHPPIDTEPEIF